VKEVKLEESKHFKVKELANGVYACIHKPGGGAYSNAGIVDLGDQTIVVDAFDTMIAGHDLRQTAEVLLGRPVDYLVLTHPHSDHWIGASEFDKSTEFFASKKTRQISKIRGTGLVRGYKKRSAWHKKIAKLEKQIQNEKDERVLVSLENTLIRDRYTVAEMAEFQPRYANQTFAEPITFQGSQRKAELRSLSRGHSEDDAVLLLPEDKIAFIGDIGFFDTQPFLGFYCDLNLHKKQLHFFLDSDYQILVPGHGPVGDKENIRLQLDYLAVMENLVDEVVQRGGSQKDAQKIMLPEPFDRWIIGGMSRFEINVRYFYKYLGGKK
jgi:glyoxylase-like metal-dependent hydrolase (beta-lactamase superfamily II)